MVPNKMPAFPSVLRRTVDDILSRAVIIEGVVIPYRLPVVAEIYKIEIGGRYPECVISQVPRYGDRFQEHLGPDHSRAEVHEDPSVQF